MAYGKKNQIKINPFNYNIGLIGESGIGKTTIIWEMCRKHLGDDGVLFAECGKEDGADAIAGLNFINCPEWSMDYDDATNSVGFEDLIDDIVENKSTDYPDLKVLVIDTYDQLVDIAKEEVVRMHNRLNPDKPVKTIKAAFGGYMAGDDKATEIVLDKLWSLKSVGVHFIIIGHVKVKSQSDVKTGQEYQTLTTNMSNRDFTAIKTKLHFLGVAYIDREFIHEKTGKKDAKGKDIIKSTIAKESRRITFRDDNYSVDSKSRFADIVNEISFDPDELYDALCDAIKAEASKGGVPVEQMKAQQEAAAEKREQEIAKAEEERKEQKSFDDKMEKIKTFIKENVKNNMDAVREIAKMTKKMGYENPTLITKPEDAEAVLTYIESL